MPTLPVLLGHAFPEAPTIPRETLSPLPIGKLLTPLVAVRDELTWVGPEVLWSADIFARLMVSVVVLRAVTRLTSEWFFPREIWNQSDQILKGFAGEEETPPVGERPRLIHEMASTNTASSIRGSSGSAFCSNPNPVPNVNGSFRVTTDGIGVPPSRRCKRFATKASKAWISMICAMSSSARTEIVGAVMATVPA